MSLISFDSASSLRKNEEAESKEAVRICLDLEYYPVHVVNGEEENSFFFLIGTLINGIRKWWKTSYNHI